MNYTPNRQARGLRTSRSGLVALLLPLYDNRFFSHVAQSFEAHVREAGMTPIVSSTGRDPAQELATAEQLLSYAPDALVICGATDPDAISDLCHRIGQAHVTIDLAGTKSHSVVSDNRNGARLLAEAVIGECESRSPELRAEEFCFFGGRQDTNTHERLGGFLAARKALLGDIGAAGCYVSGYSPLATQRDLEKVIEGTGKLPRAIFFNSTLNLEGLLGVLARHPEFSPADLVVGCVDYDPFASFLPFPVFMLEQDVEVMLAKAFDLLKRWHEPPEMHCIAAKLIAPRSAVPGPIFRLRDVD